MANYKKSVVFMTKNGYHINNNANLTFGQPRNANGGLCVITQQIVSRYAKQVRQGYNTLCAGYRDTLLPSVHAATSDF